jgi:hypothetical protein
LLVSDVRAQLEVGERVLPLCPSRDKLLADCRALQAAAERKAGIGVVDWRASSSSTSSAAAAALLHRNHTPVGLYKLKSVDP